jgi:hypothetical protein
MKKLLCIVVFTVLCISCPEPAGADRLAWMDPDTGVVHELDGKILCPEINKAIEKIAAWGHKIQHMAEECGKPTEHPECVAEWAAWHYMSVIFQKFQQNRAEMGCSES